MADKALRLAILILVLIPCVSAGSDSLSVDNMDEIFVSVGDSVTIETTATAGDFLDYQLLEVYGRNLVTMEETVLSRISNFTDVLESVDGYTINITEVSGTEKTVTLFIEAISFEDDGAIDFHMLSTTGSSNHTASKDVTVVLAPESVKVKLGNNNARATNSSQAVKVSAGNITVYCIAEESNPAVTNLSISLNGNDVTLSTDPDFELESDDERKYNSNVSAILQVSSSLTGTQTLVCTAVDYFRVSHSVQITYSLSTGHVVQIPGMGLVVLIFMSLLWNGL